MTTVKELIATGVFPLHKLDRRDLVQSFSLSLDRSSRRADGMGWVCLHSSVTMTPTVSASGIHRCLRRAYYMKEVRPFASQLVVWDVVAALAFAKRLWQSFTDEEKADIDVALHAEMFPKADHKAIAAASPFAQWSKKAVEVISPAPGVSMPLDDRLIEAQALLAAGPVEHASPETDASIY